MNNSVLCQKGLGLHAKQKMKMHSEGFFFSSPEQKEHKSYEQRNTGEI